MSFENGGNNLRLNTDNTAFVVNQGNVNHGFCPDHPETPPPKYEDVISGEYLKPTGITYIHPPPGTDLTSVTCDFTNPQTYITQTDLAPEEQNEECKCSPVWETVVIIDTTNKSIVCNRNSLRCTFYGKSFVTPDYHYSRRTWVCIAPKVTIIVIVVVAIHYKIFSEFGKFD